MFGRKKKFTGLIRQVPILVHFGLDGPGWYVIFRANWVKDSWSKPYLSLQWVANCRQTEPVKYSLESDCATMERLEICLRNHFDPGTSRALVADFEERCLIIEHYIDSAD